MSTHSPQYATQFNEALTLKPRAISLREKQKAYLQINLLDSMGKNLDLTTVGVESPGGSSSSSSSSSSGQYSTVHARFYEASGRDTAIYKVVAQVLDSAEGLVKAFVPTQLTDAPGIYYADIGVLDTDENLILDNSCFIYVERSGWGDPKAPVGPQLLRNIRASLAENDPIQSLLREEYVYDLSDICYAAVRAIQHWNDQDPPIARYSTKNFPFPDIWLTGIQLMLFEAIEEFYRRNAFQFTAAGMSADDMNKHQEYKQAWQERFAEWRRKIMHKKASINMHRGFASLGSGYTIGQVSAINNGGMH